jgi:hypothetical protein
MKISKTNILHSYTLGKTNIDCYKHTRGMPVYYNCCDIETAPTVLIKLACNTTATIQ